MWGFMVIMDQKMAILGKICPKSKMAIFAKLVIFDFRQNGSKIINIGQKLIIFGHESSVFLNHKIALQKSTREVWFWGKKRKNNVDMTEVRILFYFFVHCSHNFFFRRKSWKSDQNTRYSNGISRWRFYPTFLNTAVIFLQKKKSTRAEW